MKLKKLNFWLHVQYAFPLCTVALKTHRNVPSGVLVHLKRGQHVQKQFTDR